MSARGGAQKDAWHRPLRQIAPPSHGQPQTEPRGALANACDKAAMYWELTALLTATSVQPSQAAAGQVAT
ncbi:MAG: hypothetical protein JOZ69_07680 [Myxococcales bacterium]|nr:hypothetical protein [Myxococcales bacterium]